MVEAIKMINNNFYKMLLGILFLPFFFLYGFSNFASASTEGMEIEVTLEYGCGITVPGFDPILQPTPVTFEAVVPSRVSSGKEFSLENTVVTVNFPVQNPSDSPIPSSIESPNFKINSKNEEGTALTFGSDYKFEVPANTIGQMPIIITGENGVSVGPFTAGQEGDVILVADEIRMNVELGVLNIGYVCYPSEDKDYTIASIPIDNEAPVITLNGDNPMLIKQGDPYNEPGATANDNFDGDVSDDIEITGDVDTNTIGTYTVTYSVSDSVGNVATVERIVNVVEPFGHWYTGEGPPSDELGSNGDSYLDLTTGDVYKRDPNTWTKVGNIKGDDGKQGSKIHTGSGSPKAALGDIGDLYLDTKTGDVYEKTENGWVKVANLQGPAGPSGPKGPKGTDGTGGSGGDGTGTGKKGSGTAKGDGDAKGTTAKGGKLPKTATSLPAFILVGILLVMVGAVLFLRRQQAMEK